MTGASACVGTRPPADGGEAREAAARELERNAPTNLCTTLLASQGRDTLLQRYLTACGGDATAALQVRHRSAGGVRGGSCRFLPHFLILR
jgi:hypothetical protein